MMRVQTWLFRIFITFLLFLLVSLLIDLISQKVVFAQEALPLWRQNLDCGKREDQEYQGVEYCTGFIEYDSTTGIPGKDQVKVHVIVVDTHANGIRLEYIIAKGVDQQGEVGPCRDVNRIGIGRVGCNTPKQPQYYPVMTFDEAITRALELEAMALINGDYSACTQSRMYCDGHETPYRAHGPEGLTIVGTVSQERLDGPNMGDTDNNAEHRPFLIAGNSTPLRVEFRRLDRDTDTGAVPCLEQDAGSVCPEWAYTGMGGGPWLIHGDMLMEGSISSCENTQGSCYDSAIQTAAGQTQDKRWLFLVVADKPNKLLDLAKFMKDNLDCYEAIKLDGGGSSSMWYGGVKKYSPSRELTNFLAVIAETGSGIDVSRPGEELPSDPGDESGEGGFAGWTKKIQKTWDGLMQWAKDLPSLPDRLWNQAKNWVEEQVKAWAEQKVKELTEALLSLCLTGLSLSTGAIILAGSRKHMKQ